SVLTWSNTAARRSWPRASTSAATSPATALATRTAIGATEIRSNSATSTFESGRNTTSSSSSRPPLRGVCPRRSIEGSCVETVVTGSIVDTDCVVPEGWNEVDNALERTFELDSFVAALAFVNRVGELAEAENHHPDIAINYNRVTLRWWTHTA